VKAKCLIWGQMQMAREKKGWEQTDINKANDSLAE
jgi:hypothetical protein